MTWRPILDGDDAARARALVAEIADDLTTRSCEDPSLGSGSAGFALLHGYRALDGDEASADRAVDALAHSLEHVMQQPVPGLYVGYGGIAFAGRHLQPVIGEVDALVDLDRLIEAALLDSRWTTEYELREGLIGFGVYLQERGARVEAIVAELVARAERVATGLRWQTPLPDDGINLGIAHGVAGVVGFLAEVGEASALRGAVAWLRAQIRDSGVPCIPMVLERTRARDVVLDGWCYGEPSTAAVLVRAGQALGEPEWMAAGRDLALRAARRSAADLAACAIDLTLCHGTISRAHLFNRLGQALGDDELLHAARHWYRETLRRSAGWQELESGLQGGAVGIGLGLLAGCSPIEPSWDRALLVALPTASPRAG